MTALIALPLILSATKGCSVEGCDREHRAKGFCNVHYRRRHNHGDPMITMRGKDGPLHGWIAKLLAAPSIDGCVSWPFARDVQQGYGKLTVDGRRCIASRYICEAAHGAPPTFAHQAAHSCGNPLCVNPSHLRWATPSENAADKIIHGTVVRGEKVASSKLTEKQVRQIFCRYKAGETQEEIAKHFGIDSSGVSEIATGRRWAWMNLHQTSGVR